MSIEDGKYTGNPVFDKQIARANAEKNPETINRLVKDLWETRKAMEPLLEPVSGENEHTGKPWSRPNRLAEKQGITPPEKQRLQQLRDTEDILINRLNNWGYGEKEIEDLVEKHRNSMII